MNAPAYRETVPPAATTAPHRLLALSALGLVYSVIAIDAVMVTGVAPTIAGALEGLALVGWLFTAYLLTWTVTIPLYGRLADLGGRRPLLLVGTVLFAGGSLLAASAQSMEQLVACRLLQGLGTGSIQPVAQTAAGDLFPPHQRARAQIVFSIVFFVVSIGGPLLAGVLVATLGWRAVFVLEAAVAALGAVAIRLCLPPAGGHHLEAPDAQAPATRRPAVQLDWLGTLLLVAWAGALLVALAQVSRGASWAAPSQLALYAAAAVGLPLFLWHEARAPAPLVPLGLLRQRLLGAFCLLMFVAGATINAWQPFVPLFVQGVLALGPAEAGLLALPFNAAWLLTNALAPGVFWHRGYRFAVVLGLALMGWGYGLLVLPRGDLPGAYLLVLVALGILGGGVGYLNTAAIVAVQNAVPWSRRGVATSGPMFARFLGSSLLLGLLTTFVNGRLASELAARGVEPTTPGAATATGRLAQASALLTPETRATLAPDLLAAMQAALTATVHDACLVLVGVLALALVLALTVPGGRAERHVWREGDG
jgi:MFS family permease